MKQAIFLTGAMGSGKSTLLRNASFVSQDGYICRCKEFDILGRNQLGADSLSNDTKSIVWNSLNAYEGKLIIAGEYYSKQKDINILADMGFSLKCVLLKVPRETIYQRVIKRGAGGWNEKTYATNLVNRVNFFKAFRGPKEIWANSTLEEGVANFGKLCAL